MRKSDSSHELRSADAQITSGFGRQLTSPYADRMTPRSHLMGHDPTPALRQLSAYARPHALGWQHLMKLACFVDRRFIALVWNGVFLKCDNCICATAASLMQQQQQHQDALRPPGAFPYSTLPQALLESYYRYCSMYPPGSRERY